MPFVAAAVVWVGYTAVWFGWLALTDHVQPGEAADTDSGGDFKGTTGSFWWPSLKDLVSPGRMAFAIPPRLVKAPPTPAQIADAQQQATAKAVTGLDAKIPSGNETFVGGA